MRSFDSFLMIFAVLSGVGGGLVLLVQFLSLRMRNSALAPEERDNHLGRKFALGVFLHLSVLLLLVGLTVLAVDMFEDLLVNGGRSNTPATMRVGGPGGPWGPGGPPAAKPFPNPAQRTAFGLLLSGVMHGLLFAMLMYFTTNARRQPAVSRAFVLNRLLVAGVILMSVTTTFCVMLFYEGDMQIESVGRIVGLAVVWGPAALGHFLWLMFGLNSDKMKASRVAEVARPRESDRDSEREQRPTRHEEGGRPRRREDDDDDRPRQVRRSDDD